MNKQHIPNLLTLARIAIIPLCIGLWYAEIAALYGWLCVVFIAASLTDFLDGYLARKWNVTSPMGAMLDPMADKLLVATLLILLTHDAQIPPLITIVILLREIFIAGLRECLALQHIALPVSRGGKWKTALQLIALSLLLYALSVHNDGLRDIATILLALSAGFALVSALHYTRYAIQAL